VPSAEELRRRAAFSRAKREVAASSDDTLLRRSTSLRNALFAQQLDFLNDPSTRKTLLCPRRAGKTEAMCAALIDTALRRRNATCVYITITLKVAKRNLWRKLKEFNDRFELGASFHNTELTMTFSNGSIIQLGGAETQADIDKYRGFPADIIVLDESKSFPGELIDELVQEVLTPCLHDRVGTLVLGGTPGAILAGAFYEATRDEAFLIATRPDGTRHAMSRPYGWREKANWAGVSFRWSHHSWMTRENVAMPHIWPAQLAEKEQNGWTDEHPTWQREYLGKWVPSTDGMVFRFDRHRDTWQKGSGPGFNQHGLPDEHDWEYVLGIDLGYDDDTAIVVFAWSDTCDTMYQVDEYSSPYMLPNEIADKIREFEATYGDFAIMVGDRGGLGKTILEELDHRYGVKIHPADKHEKRDHVELFNADLITGKLKILAESRLALQMAICQWDETGRRFDKDLPDHCVDAAIYIWRYCHHHFSRGRNTEPERGSSEWWKWKMDQEFQLFREREERRAFMAEDERLEEDMALDYIDDEAGWRLDS
jgi:hypothetical protein